MAPAEEVGVGVAMEGDAVVGSAVWAAAMERAEARAVVGLGSGSADTKRGTMCTPCTHSDGNACSPVEACTRDRGGRKDTGMTQVHERTQCGVAAAQGPDAARIAGRWQRAPDLAFSILGHRRLGAPAQTLEDD